MSLNNAPSSAGGGFSAASVATPNSPFLREDVGFGRMQAMCELPDGRFKDVPQDSGTVSLGSGWAPPRGTRLLEFVKRV